MPVKEESWNHGPGVPINAAVEVLGDRWSLLVLRDVIFGDRRYFRALLTGSIEGIARTSSPTASYGSSTRGSSPAAPPRAAARSLQPHGSRHPDSSDHLRLGNWGLDWRPGSAELRSRQQFMREEGPAFVEELMDELRVRHLGAPPGAARRSRPVRAA
jgi:hypothetical protein